MCCKRTTKQQSLLHSCSQSSRHSPRAAGPRRAPGPRALPRAHARPAASSPPSSRMKQQHQASKTRPKFVKHWSSSLQGLDLFLQARLRTARPWLLSHPQMLRILLPPPGPLAVPAWWRAPRGGGGVPDRGLERFGRAADPLRSA